MRFIVRSVWSVKERRFATDRCYEMGDGNAGDFIDAFVDALHDSSPGIDCYDEDTVRSVLAKMLDESGE